MKNPPKEGGAYFKNEKPHRRSTSKMKNPPKEEGAYLKMKNPPKEEGAYFSPTARKCAAQDAPTMAARTSISAVTIAISQMWGRWSTPRLGGDGIENSLYCRI